MLSKDYSNSERKVYINECKDKRVRVLIVYKDGTRRQLSYPRFILEEELHCSLSPLDDVHHIDENSLNNDLTNFKIIPHGEHQRNHSKKYKDKIVCCYYCGKEILWTAKQQQIFQANKLRKENNNKDRHVFCSRHCSGKYGKLVQSKQYAGVAELRNMQRT